jgi:hypothetical protein
MTLCIVQCSLFPHIIAFNPQVICFYPQFTEKEVDIKEVRL